MLEGFSGRVSTAPFEVVRLQCKVLEISHKRNSSGLFLVFSPRPVISSHPSILGRDGAYGAQGIPGIAG